jgi:hypothetical protein
MSNMAALVAGRPYTRADLENTPDDGRRTIVPADLVR